MRDDAILAMVEAGGGDHDHLPLGLGQAAGLLHQRVMIGEEGAELVGTARQRQKDVGHEAGLFLHRRDPLGDVGGQVLEVRRFESADRCVAHGPRLCFPARMLSSRPRGFKNRPRLLFEDSHGIRRLHFCRDPARPADRRAGRPRQNLRRASGADRACRPRRARRVRPRRAPSPGLRDFGAGGGAGGGGRAHETHQADERRDGAVVRRSGARLPAVRHARLRLGRAGGDHGRARRVHRILPAVRLRSRGLRDAVRGKPRASARHPQGARGPTGGAGAVRRWTARASIRALCRTPCPSGSPRAARRSRWRAQEASACRSRSPSSAASRRASPRSPRSIASPRAARASPESLAEARDQWPRLCRRHRGCGGRRLFRALTPR